MRNGHEAQLASQERCRVCCCCVVWVVMDELLRESYIAESILSIDVRQCHLIQANGLYAGEVSLDTIYSLEREHISSPKHPHVEPVHTITHKSHNIRITSMRLFRLPALARQIRCTHCSEGE